MYAGLIKAALSDTPGTINAGTPVTITANGTWKAAASGDTVYALSLIHISSHAALPVSECEGPSHAEGGPGGGVQEDGCQEPRPEYSLGQDL